MNLAERIRDPKFTAMIIAPMIGAISAVMSGHATWQAGVICAVIAIVCGVLGISQPSPKELEQLIQQKPATAPLPAADPAPPKEGTK